MGHYVRAIIGVHKDIQRIENNYWLAKEIKLPQGYGMIFLTDALLDNIGELFESANEPSDPETVTIYLLQVHSFHTKQAYIETSVSRYAAEKSRLQYLSIHWWRKKMTRTAKRKWTEMNLSKI